MRFIIIGNILSLFAAIFRALSSCVNERKKVFTCQFLECLILCVASGFFGSWSGITTLGLSAARNILVAKDKFNRNIMIIFVVLVAVSGALANNRGLIGLLPVFATLEYTICCYYVKGVLATKYSIFINIALWVAYCFVIFDFVTAVTDLAVLAVGAVSIVRMHIEGYRKKTRIEDVI